MTAEPSYLTHCSLHPAICLLFAFSPLRQLKVHHRVHKEADTHLGDDMFISPYKKFPVASGRASTPFCPQKGQRVASATNTAPPMWQMTPPSLILLHSPQGVGGRGVGGWGGDAEKRTSASLLQAQWKGDGKSLQM